MGSLKKNAESMYIYLKCKQKDLRATESDLELLDILIDYINIRRYREPVEPTYWEEKYNCRHCGNTFDKKPKFCSNCGQRQNWRRINDRREN